MAHVDATTLSLLALGEDIDADLGHILDCPRCHGELTSLRRTVMVAERGDLTDEDILGLVPQAPPSHVWTRIHEAMLTPAVEPHRRKIVCPNWSVAASVALGLVLGGGVVHMAAGYGTPASPQMAHMSQTIATVALSPAGGRERAQASAEIVSDGQSARLALNSSGLPRRAGTRYLVVLRETDDDRVELGAITSDIMSFDIPRDVALTYDLSVDVLAAPAGNGADRRTQVLSGGVTPHPNAPLVATGPDGNTLAVAEGAAGHTLPAAGAAGSAFSAGSIAVATASRSLPTAGTSPLGPVTGPTGLPTTTDSAPLAPLAPQGPSAPAVGAGPGAPSQTQPSSSPVAGVPGGSAAEAPAGAPESSGSVAASVGQPGTTGGSAAPPAVVTHPGDTGSGSTAPDRSGSVPANSGLTSLLAPANAANSPARAETTTSSNSSTATSSRSTGESKASASSGKSSTKPVAKRKKRKKRVKAVPLPGAPPVTPRVSASTRPSAVPTTRVAPTPSPAATPSPSALVPEKQSAPPASS